MPIHVLEKIQRHNCDIKNKCHQQNEHTLLTLDLPWRCTLLQTQCKLEIDWRWRILEKVIVFSCPHSSWRCCHFHLNTEPCDDTYLISLEDGISRHKFAFQWSRSQQSQPWLSRWSHRVVCYGGSENALYCLHFLLNTAAVRWYPRTSILPLCISI